MTPDASPYPPPQCKPQDPTRFVLVGASHPGNVGATARAMKVMGFADLVLVAPRWADVLSREETLAFASGATDVLERARIVPTLRQALDGITWACATVMTPRDFGPPTHAPREHFAALAPEGRRVAFVFGGERHGLTSGEQGRGQAQQGRGGGQRVHTGPAGKQALTISGKGIAGDDPGRGDGRRGIGPTGPTGPDRHRAHGCCG